MKVYEVITNTIIEKLEKGVVPWHQPWIGGLPKNYVSKKTYRGINLTLLNMMGFSSPSWLTMKQANQLGGKIRKGEKSTIVVFWKWLIVKQDDQEDDDEKQIPCLRYYRVFNIEQTEGIEVINESEKRCDFKPITRCEYIVAHMPNRPLIQHNEARAYYNIIKDFINMPKPELFESEEEYYCTLFHELSHSTGHSSRLNRKTIVDVQPLGTTDFSGEELIAEIGAAFLCGYTGIQNATIDNSASYINGWLGKLKVNKKMLINAAAKAQKAIDYITGKKGE